MRLGIPQPRLTKAPSGNSSAARWAICSRVSCGLDKAQTFRLHDTIHENGRSYDGLRIKRPHFDNLIHFDDRQFRRGRHDGVEIPRGFAINKISETICSVGFDEGAIRSERFFKNVSLAADQALFLPP